MGSFSDSSKLRKGVLALALALACVLSFGFASTAFAAPTIPFGEVETNYVTPADNLIKTYGVRAGSAGADYLGVTNTNYDVCSAKPADGIADWSKINNLSAADAAGLAIWGTSLNESPNPYLANLLKYSTGASEDLTVANRATTWMANPDTSSWGDSNNAASTKGNVSGGDEVIQGLEYSPEIIFGANKTTAWNLKSDGSNSNTNFYTADQADASWNPVYVTNDATNVWTQIYTMGQLATAADGLDGVTRYNSSNASVSALDYEKAIRGQMLYVASKIDSGDQEKKTVAYLYAIDSTGKAYFFVPEASGLLTGNDTGETSSSAQETADGNYAANNSTINMGYMAVLPFITNTFTGGTELDGGIVMKVEDIWKKNPVHTVDLATGIGDEVLKDVDIIIYNSTKNTDLAGTSGGKNSSGVNNDYNSDNLSASEVTTWAASHGFNGQVIAGDDFGTSNQQGVGSVTATEEGMSPLLYCQRNYTPDKDTRAAWGISQVYPELYDNDANATYGYWLDKIYHLTTAGVNTVGAYMTNQSDAFGWTDAKATTLEGYADEGYAWWTNTGSADTTDGWASYAYYSGSSRASYYGGGQEAEEANNTIGIFTPSALWAADYEPELEIADIAVLTEVTVTDHGSAVASSNYDVYYGPNTDAGQVTVFVVGKGDYAGLSASANFTITPMKISEAYDVVNSLSYTGAEQDVTIAFYTGKPNRDDTVQFTEGTDYTWELYDAAGNEITSKKVKDMGVYTVKATGVGNLTGTYENKMEVAGWFNVKVVDKNGVEILSKAYSKDEFEALKSESTDYVSAIYGSNVATATEYVTLDDLLEDAGASDYWSTAATIEYAGSDGFSSGKKNYDQVMDGKFYGTLSSLSNASQVTPEAAEEAVDAPLVFAIKSGTAQVKGAITTFGQAQTSAAAKADTTNEPRVIYGINTSYADSEGNLSDAAGNRLISKVMFVTVHADKTLVDIASTDVASIAAVTYNGKQQTPKPVVKYGSTTLAEGTDYTLSYGANVNAGTGTVTIEGIGDYTGTKTVEFTIDKASQTITTTQKATVAKAGNVSKATSFKLGAAATAGELSYATSNKKVATVKNGTVTIVKNVTGTAKITITAAATANYKAASKTITVKVTPGKMVVKTAKNTAAKKATITWTKMTGASQYQLRYKVKGASKWTTKKVASSKAKLVLSKLKKGKTYQVQIRAYNKALKSYGTWSAAKSVKIRK